MNKKGQLMLGDAPTVALIVGLTFLVLATVALIGQKYQEAFPADKAVSVVNESVTQTELATNAFVDGASECEAQDFVIGLVFNASEGLPIEAANFTFTEAGQLTNLTGEYSDTNSVWNVSYTYNHAGTACNVTTDLQTNISDNTSIAGIVLTISLVGIVLSILIGVFLGVRRSRI